MNHQLSRNTIQAASDEKNYRTKIHNPAVAISVSHSVKLLRGMQLCIWATERLSEYLIKGFTMNDELPKQFMAGTLTGCLSA